MVAINEQKTASLPAVNQSDVEQRSENELVVRYSLVIARAQLSMFLVLVLGVLLANHVVLQVCKYRFGKGHYVLEGLFNVDHEDSFPTWYSAALLLFAAGLLYLIATTKARARERFARHWLLLSVGFLSLSIDEVAGVHEALNTVIDIPWTIPGCVVVAIVGLSYLRFLIHLPLSTRIRFIVAGFLYVGGVVGVEHATDWYLEDYSMQTLGYNLFTALEEGLEMLGVVLFINALLEYMDFGNSGQVLALALGPLADKSPDVRVP